MSRSYQTVSLSDHHCQVMEVDISVARLDIHHVSVCSFCRCPWDEVRQSLSSVPWNVMDVYDDIDDTWGFFVSILYHCLDTYAPSHTVPVKYSCRPTPWMT